MLKTLGLSEQNVDIIPNKKRNKLERSISKITALGENMLDVSVIEAEKVFAMKMEENKIQKYLTFLTSRKAGKFCHMRS